MSKRKLNFDPRVYDLVALFLSDNPELDNEGNRILLAEHIQVELEDWIQFILKPTVMHRASIDMEKDQS